MSCLKWARQALTSTIPKISLQSTVWTKIIKPQWTTMCTIHSSNVKARNNSERLRKKTPTLVPTNENATEKPTTECLQQTSIMIWTCYVNGGHHENQETLCNELMGVSNSGTVGREHVTSLNKMNQEIRNMWATYTQRQWDFLHMA
jgi:hypothetical protein